MSSVDASAIAHSTSTGGQLVFAFIIYDASGDPINDPTEVSAINIFSGTSDVDALTTISATLTGDDLVNSVGNLINTYTVSGYTPLAQYFTEFTVVLADYSTVTVDLTDTIYGGITQIQPTITAIAQDNYVAYTFDASSAAQMTSQMGYAGEPYAHMYAAIRVNDGSGGFVRHRFPWATVLANNLTVTVDQSNGIPYEAYGQYLSDQIFLVGVSKTSVGLITTATNFPNPPTEVATISTFEYNRYNAVSVYSVPDASSVTVLFNPPVGQDTTTTFYTIYKYDLSNNGYSTPTFDSSFNILVDASGAYTYQDSTANPLTYKYRYQDSNVVAGKFYAYAISGTNAYGTGILTSQYGVREGQKCTQPSITTSSGVSSTAITVTIVAPSGITGGFDLSNNGYTIAYNTGINPVTYVSGLSAGPNTITGLTTGASYTFAAYAETTNTNYTTVGTVVSSSNTGPVLTYLSTISNSSTIIPYVAPPPPTSVLAALDYSAGIPTGYVNVSWDASSTFLGSTVYFQYARSDASSTWILTDSSGTAQSFINNANDVLGTSIYYSVRSYIIVGSVLQYSVTNTNSNSVTPFLPPDAPTFNSIGAIGLKVNFNLNPPPFTGGLVPVIYDAVLTSDASGNVLIPGAAPFNDISANVTYVSRDLSSNLTVYVKANAYVVGPDASGILTRYLSPPVIQLAGVTQALPVVIDAIIDASGILIFTTINNGSLLNFAEAIIVDASGQLNLSLTTGLFVPPSTMTIVSNTAAGSVINVDFNDPNIPRPQLFSTTTPYSPLNTLIVVANSIGASVFDTLETIP